MEICYSAESDKKSRIGNTRKNATWSNPLFERAGLGRDDAVLLAVEPDVWWTRPQLRDRAAAYGCSYDAVKYWVGAAWRRWRWLERRETGLAVPCEIRGRLGADACWYAYRLKPVAKIERQAVAETLRLYGQPE